jgi:Mn-containing catalase
VFFHTKRFQYNAKPDAPDPIFAKQMQELIGGQWGEMSVMVNYLFQGWNCRGPAKYRDMLLDTATEEISNFPQEREMSSVAYKFQNFSEGTESQEGRWASGPTMDGKGEFEYVADPEAMGPQMDELDPPVEPRLYSTPKQPMSPASS